MKQKIFTLHDKIVQVNQNKKQTKFKKMLLPDKKPLDILTDNRHEAFDNVLCIGYSDDFGHVFKAWNDGDEQNFHLYIGVAGDEFLEK